MLIFPGLIPLQFSSNKIQATFSWTQCPVLPKPCSSPLAMPISHFKTQFRPKKGLGSIAGREMSVDTKVPEIPAKGQRTTSHMSQTQYYLLAWTFPALPCFREEKKVLSSQMYFLCTFSGHRLGVDTLNCSLPIFISQSSICGSCQIIYLVVQEAPGEWWWWLECCPNGECPKAPESGQSEALLLD